MSQLTLEAVEFAVEEAVAVHWSREVKVRFDALCRLGVPFTSDDLWRNLPDDLVVGRPNLIGDLFMVAAKNGRIKKTGRTVRSERPERRGGTIHYWQPVTP